MTTEIKVHSDVNRAVEFVVELRGVGRSIEEAWEDATENFCQEPGMTGSEDVKFLSFECPECGMENGLDKEDWFRPMSVECECGWKGEIFPYADTCRCHPPHVDDLKVGQEYWVRYGKETGTFTITNIAEDSIAVRGMTLVLEALGGDRDGLHYISTKAWFMKKDVRAHWGRFHEIYRIEHSGR